MTLDESLYDAVVKQRDDAHAELALANESCRAQKPAAIEAGELMDAYDRHVETVGSAFLVVFTFAVLWLGVAYADEINAWIAGW